MILVVILITGVIVGKIITDSNGDNYDTEEVKRADIVEMVDESGVIKISGLTDIYSPTNGVIEEVYVSNGTMVKTGQELFKVKSTATKQEQQAAYANYLAAKATLDTAQSNQLALQADMFGKWDTFKELAESDDYEDADGNPKYANRAVPEFHIPEKEWLAAEKKYIDQKDVIAQAQAATYSTWNLYLATQTAVVKSIADGTVANLSVVASDSVSTASQPVLTVANYTVIGVMLSLGEADIGKVQVGDLAKVDVDPIHNKTYNGVVRRVDEIGDESEPIVKYHVFVEITDRDDQLKSGMSADVIIVTKKVSDVLSVSNSAVKSYKGGKAVQVVNTNGELEFIPVQIGVKGEKRTEILKGLSLGQDIVTALTNEQDKRSGFGF